VARVGIGLARETIATQLISLAPGEVRQLPVPIRYYRAIDLDTDLGAHGFETGDGLVVDISHPYDAQTDNNHGESIIALIYRRRPVDSGGVPFADAIPIALGNPTAAAREYVLSVLPNSISAVVTPSHATVAPGALTHLPLNYVRPTNGGVDANVTIVARDPGGNLIGGMNVHFYFD
jgi:hypothetical protein